MISEVKRLFLGAVRDPKIQRSKFENRNSKQRVWWLAFGIIFLVGISGCGQRGQEDASELSQRKDRISKKIGREVLQEELRQSGKELPCTGDSGRKLALKELLKEEGSLKKELQMTWKEAKELGASDIDDYRLKNGKNRLEQEVRSIVEKNGVQLSGEDIDYLVRRYVEKPLISARTRREAEQKMEKDLVDISREVEGLLQSDLSWAEKEAQKEKFREKLHDALDIGKGPGVISEEEENEYFEKYVEKLFEGAKK